MSKSTLTFIAANSPRVVVVIVGPTGSGLGCTVAVGLGVVRTCVAALGSGPTIEAAAGHVIDARVVVGLDGVAVGALAVDRIDPRPRPVGRCGGGRPHRGGGRRGRLARGGFAGGHRREPLRC